MYDVSRHVCRERGREGGMVVGGEVYIFASERKGEREGGRDGRRWRGIHLCFGKKCLLSLLAMHQTHASGRSGVWRGDPV